MAATSTLDLQRVQIIPLPSRDCISQFRCGVQEIDSWAREKCFKHNAEFRSRVFCAFLDGSNVPLGFYSLSFASEQAKTLNDKYRDIYKGTGVPLIYIQYLAVQVSVQSSGLGTVLLMNALERAHYVSQHVAFYGVALRSLNERTLRLYEKYGFGQRETGPHPLMILPIWTVRDLFGGSTDNSPTASSALP
jgi:ribosomal protein S18 acetylase RimI-like enzyme